jgi:hypothetical protein
MLVETSLVRQLAIRIPAEPGHRNDEGIVQFRSLPQLPRDLVPVHARHGDIQKDDVRKKWPDGLQRAGPIVYDANFMTAQAEQFGYQVMPVHTLTDAQLFPADATGTSERGLGSLLSQTIADRRDSSLVRRRQWAGLW